jgi:hypothetical protein
MKEISTQLWLRIQEPRKQSVVYFFVYLLTAGLGAVILLDPPHALQGTLGQALVLTWAGMLVIGGGTGMLFVLPGWWWAERAGTWLCAFAMLVYGVGIFALPVTQLSLRFATLIFMLLGTLLFVVRILKTRHASYDPEK